MFNKKLIKSINKIFIVLITLMLMVSGLEVLPSVIHADDGEEAIYLSDLNWVSAKSGWKTVQKDKNVDGQPIKMNGTIYTKGLGTHANSEIIYHLDGQYSIFKSTIGPDDKHINNPAKATSIIFQVYGDGEKLYDSGVMRMYPDSLQQNIEIDISGINELKLIVDDAGEPIENPNHSDWANWADARVLKVKDPSTMLSEIKIDDEALPGFVKEKMIYDVEVEENTPVPTVTASVYDANATLSIQQASTVPGTAIITVKNNSNTSVYKINFIPRGIVYLSDLNWTSAISGYQTVQKDKNVNNGPINVLGKVYSKGLGTHANSVIKYDLDGKYTRFKADVGIDFAKQESNATVEFIVKADGIVRFTSGVISTDFPYDQPVDISVEGVKSLELIVTDAGDGNTNDWANWADARLVIGEPTGTLLNQIYLDNEPLSNFSKGKLEYDVVLPAGTTKPPLVTVEKEDEEAIFDISEPAKLPGTTTIKVTKGTNTTSYRIHFTLKDNGLDYIHLSADKIEINPLLNPDEVSQLFVEAVNGDGSTVNLKDPGVEVKYSIESLYKSSESEVATVNKNGVVRPDKDESGHWVGGVAKVKVTVTIDGKTKEDTINIIVRPFYIDYSKTLVMKYFLARNGNVELNLEEALEATKKIDNLTRGIPKVVYLVGWQFEGHDSKYPSWDEVNKGLKRAQDETAEDSLIWLMEEAKKYNTTISLHMNMTTAFPDSPLWDEYVAADLIGKVGKKSAGVYNGVEVKEGDYSIYGGSHAISYYRDWNSGLLQQRIQRLINMLPPLKDGQTIHTDAFHLVIPSSTNPTRRNLNISEWHQEREGYTNEDEVKTMRKIFQYWRDQGFDLTSEFVDSYRDGETFVGLQPMAWHFRGAGAQKNWLLNVPASLYAGGDGPNALYGMSMLGEGRVKRNNLANLNGFLQDFALNTLPWYYLNRLQRLSDDGMVVQFSDDVRSYMDGDKVTIKQGDKLLRIGGDVFIPVLWRETNKEIMAYSQNGYTNKVWEFPSEWSNVTNVDIYRLSVTGLVKEQLNVPIINGKITLSLANNAGVSIVPAGTDINTVSGIVLDKEHLTLQKGEEKNLIATVQPEQAENKDVIWTSLDPNVAKVDENGRITGNAYGTTIITVSTKDGKYSRDCIVYVAPKQVKAPISNLPSKVYDETKIVTLESDTPGASIYYTVGGAEPNDKSQLYTGPIRLAKGVNVIRAIAVKDGMRNSNVTAYAYNITEDNDPTAAQIAEVIKSLVAPKKGEKDLTLPSLPEGFTISIKSSDRPDIVNIDGSIHAPTRDTIVNLILEVTRMYDGEKADTGVIPVVVPASDVTIQSIRDTINTYIQSGDLSGPLIKQLQNRLDQAEEYLDKGNQEKAVKKMQDFLKHLDNEPMQRFIKEEAKEYLKSDTETLIALWINL
ncbi:NPCBM/NEW2 domain-containing protein [Lederbergia citri]|uniref:NPCBM/NEW2 domain-containing protein n=1 Tax=Lederbergia citri TaxID=2833580 RepID=A0A942TFU0_9BACI|nr:NPCBM/NEW2 domain-containing protein [Lederbergia citri]MBS4196898.1 NPCBM/NEW2 domain-containing protein [Lederbergia citri]